MVQVDTTRPGPDAHDRRGPAERVGELGGVRVGVRLDAQDRRRTGLASCGQGTRQHPVSVADRLWAGTVSRSCASSKTVRPIAS